MNKDKIRANRRKLRVRKKLNDIKKHKLLVFRSSKHIYASVLSESNDKTLCSFSSVKLEKADGQKKVDLAKQEKQEEFERFLSLLKTTELSRDEALAECSMAKERFSQEILEKEAKIKELKSEVLSANSHLSERTADKNKLIAELRDSRDNFSKLQLSYERAQEDMSHTLIALKENESLIQITLEEKI